MRHYSAALNDGIRARVAQWSGTTFPFYPAIKQLTLDLDATSFLGIPWGPEAERINKAFVDMEQASIGVVPVQRSDERRVGKVCVITCKSRWSPCHEKKKSTSIDLK